MAKPIPSQQASGGSRFWLLFSLLAVCAACKGGNSSSSGGTVVATTTQTFENACDLPNAGSEIVNSIGMKLVRIEPGEFTMGWPEEIVKGMTPDDYRVAGGPLQKVTITRPFYLGAYEVTQAEYEAVVGVNPSAHQPGGQEMFANAVADFDATTLPVEQVSWDDAMEFCRRLSEREEEQAAGRVYVLPTEAQWEYASRAGANTVSAYGDVLTSDLANFNGERPWPNSAASGPNLDRPQPVGSYEPNAWGLYDMHGNVQEWCRDSWRTLTPEPVTDPIAAVDDPQYRCLRGGAYNKFGVYCTSCYRNRYPKSSTNVDAGLRVMIQL